MNPASASLPVHSGRSIGQSPAPVQHVVNEDEELDQIMRDVGDQLKKEDFKRPKRQFFGLKRKPKREVPFSAQIVHNPQKFQKPEPATEPSHPKPMPRTDLTAVPRPHPQPTPQQTDAAEVQLAKIQPHPKAQPAAKPKKQTSYPFFVLFVTFLVTGFLIAAAIAAYRQ